MYALNPPTAIPQSAAAIVLVVQGNRCVCDAVFVHVIFVPQVWQVPNDA